MNNLVSLTDAANAKELWLDPHMTMKAARFSLNELNQQRDAKHMMLSEIVGDGDVIQHMVTLFRTDDLGILLTILDEATTAIASQQSRMKVKVKEYKVIEHMYSDSERM